MKWTFCPASAFEQHANTWDTLNASGFNSPLLSSHFLSASLQSFKSGREMLAILGNPDQPDAMCILVKDGYLIWNTFQPTQAPIGFWLMRPGLDLEETLTDLLHALPGLSLAVGLTQLDSLLIPRPSNSDRMFAFDYIDTAHLVLNGEYETYWKSRPSHLRKDMRNVCNRLEKDGLKCKVSCISDPEEVGFAVENFARMECSGWKGELGTAVQFDSAQGEFYVHLLQSFCKGGGGCIYYLTFNEVVVAIDLCIQQGGTVYCLKTSYDQNFSKYSPGLLLHQEWFRLLWKTGECQRIEFYGRVTSWQQQLTEETRSMYHVNIYRWAWLRRMMGKQIGVRS
ncbi:MAG: GNAT family N-acetyltransferase [Proteobacteria bacterium]|nr:GNAT family N-acetyltransferase [Pseudomonadota bacterium]